MTWFPPAVTGLKTWLDTALSLAYPEVCQVCGQARAVPQEGYVCPACQADVRFIQPPLCQRCGRPVEGAVTLPFECSQCQETEWHFRHARAAVAASGVVRDVLLRYKYHQARWFEPFLAALLVRQARPQLRREDWDLMVPVPLHHLRKTEREFNQAERLAAPLAAATGIPLNVRLLERVEPIRTQTMLNRTERAANVRHAFALRRGGPALAGARIILVDDVFTTGATTNACARVLSQGGAAEICVWTVARGGA